MDPQQRLLFEVAWEAFEDAGYRPGGPVGVFVGAGGVVSSYLVDRLPFSSELPGDTGGLAHIANDKDFLSTRISYKLNLTGRASTFRLLVRPHWLPCTSPVRQFSPASVTWRLAGASTIESLSAPVICALKAASCRPTVTAVRSMLDARGTIFGSGVGIVLLKDLAAAVADRRQHLCRYPGIGRQQRWRR